MATHECYDCGGTGKENIVIIRRGMAENKEENCSTCEGKGMMRNGEPSDF
ncbi:hypothetical protein [Terrihalobacillus insolitus]|nr:hypothetical protein [Terrihalobacillus insolitus]MDC3412503.1 hypothetical protein [Terrihalobacillus insolitus]